MSGSSWMLLALCWVLPGCLFVPHRSYSVQYVDAGEVSVNIAGVDAMPAGGGSLTLDLEPYGEFRLRRTTSSIEVWHGKYVSYLGPGLSPGRARGLRVGDPPVVVAERLVLDTQVSEAHSVYYAGMGTVRSQNVTSTFLPATLTSPADNYRVTLTRQPVSAAQIITLSGAFLLAGGAIALTHADYPLPATLSGIGSGGLLIGHLFTKRAPKRTYLMHEAGRPMKQRL